MKMNYFSILPREVTTNIFFKSVEKNPKSVMRAGMVCKLFNGIINTEINLKSFDYLESDAQRKVKLKGLALKRIKEINEEEKEREKSEFLENHKIRMRIMSNLSFLTKNADLLRSLDPNIDREIEKYANAIYQE